ncbi:preprotein translocase subunit SecB [Algoriphagus iocasae]|uniref:Preprotein translocase subunit SecB n=1 Tax=Algoriphagus iocasae TaxID=1836499 RepID=A0A841N0W8_9BACT|nr:protein-export chaperone SecB [Algoriphagus iocasae]MBB6327851.1 preprotein translocase subunit SecB [Algoriphagus iocasae]
MKEFFPFSVHSQYINEFSFINPEGYLSLNITKPPVVSVDVNIEAHPLKAENYYTVTLTVKFNATNINNNTEDDIEEEFVAFTGYISYVAFVHIDVPVEDALIDDVAAEINPEKVKEKDMKIQFTLMVEVAQLLFPFVRNLIANVTREGGFPPLLVNPIDFEGMYRANVLDRLPEED